MATSTEETLKALMDMGFPPDKCEEAVKATGAGGVQMAMDWILAHEEESGSIPQDGVRTDLMQPKSLKCEDCGKVLRSELDAQAHAARSGHQNFAESTEEIKPLSAEEKAAQLAMLEERLKQKRIAREEKEKNDDKEKEKLRRKSGKELTEIKQKMELAEMKKLAEERRREKCEDRMARQRVKDQIAKNRAERESRDSKVVATTAPVDCHPKSQSTTNAKKEYTACKLQIRLLDGTTAVKSYKATSTLQDIVNELGSESTRLMTNFPKRLFTDEDLGKTLHELGLVPSAVLIQTLKRD